MADRTPAARRARTRPEVGGVGARTVYESLRAAIMDGALSPGTHLVEAALAKEYSLSRSPIREALGKLTHDGLLERHDGATRVRVLEAEDILELYEVRIALESLAARAAALDRTPEDLADLDAILARIKRLRTADADSRPGVAHDFRAAMWRAGHNPILVETLNGLRVRATALTTSTLRHPQRWKVFSADCAEVISAVRAQDADRAAAAAARQMSNAREFWLRVLVVAEDGH